MFGFKKKEKKTLMIKANDVVNIIKSDHDNDMALLKTPWDDKRLAEKAVNK